MQRNVTSRPYVSLVAPVGPSRSGTKAAMSVREFRATDAPHTHDRRTDSMSREQTAEDLARNVFLLTMGGVAGVIGVILILMR